MARWDNEKLVFSLPDINKIKCKDCAYREKDRPELSIDGATLGICQVYEFKPVSILSGKSGCAYYVKEEAGAAE